ncbi:MAG TPA: nucleoside 2-deoxyribosyltransferase [Dissulfurispiraceae bacterium]|nr:nucleoside 2-deoxyribosyltransferase [Dissulfurispiraceae bacterium]
MNIFIISTVRNADVDYRLSIERYVNNLECEGHVVYLPHRDTDQNSNGLNICKSNKAALSQADEVHIFYRSTSQGTHFDMGMAFALDKKIVIVENEQYGQGKSFPRMLEEWAVD